LRQQPSMHFDMTFPLPFLQFVSFSKETLFKTLFQSTMRTI
jgi:hypothetical protein